MKPGVTFIPACTLCDQNVRHLSSSTTWTQHPCIWVLQFLGIKLFAAKSTSLWPWERGYRFSLFLVACGTQCCQLTIFFFFAKRFKNSSYTGKSFCCQVRFAFKFLALMTAEKNSPRKWKRYKQNTLIHSVGFSTIANHHQLPHASFWQQQAPVASLTQLLMLFKSWTVITILQNSFLDVTPSRTGIIRPVVLPYRRKNILELRPPVSK